VQVETTAAALCAGVIVERSARLVAVTGGVAAGKSTLAAGIVDELAPTAAVAVATDGFLLSGHPRKGFPESYDTVSLAAFLDAVRAGDPTAWAPVYSHLTYDVVPGARADVGDAEVVIVEGLHLADPAFGVRDRFDLVVHVDADDDDLERWYLARFRELRTAAADDPDAFLHPYLSMGADALDASALDVWRAVNLVVLHDHVRPAAAFADVVLRLDGEHRLARAELRDPR
jgi:type I pantothenate kinase